MNQALFGPPRKLLFALTHLNLELRNSGTQDGAKKIGFPEFMSSKSILISSEFGR